MTDQYKEATEEHFRLRGWVRVPKYAIISGVPLKMEPIERVWIESWESRNHPNPSLYEKLPPICESIKDWKKWIAEFMEGEGWQFWIDKYDNAVWHCEYENVRDIEEPIKDHEILLASVLACNEYLREKKNG